MKNLNILIAMIMFTGLAHSQNKNAFPVQVKTGNGFIEGNYDTHTGIQTFFGVPFAKPPVGELRWKAPQPMDDWEGIKETKSFGPRPMQTMVFGDMKSRSNGVSEDCLYLNIWTPAKRNTNDLPVLVYYYGGGNVAGDASEYRYDGESMAKKGIVVVTTNYRLNVFGNLAHQELSAESPYKASGNYGQLDQNMALQWVHKNIAAFGGDPKKVTIAGESAGSIGTSVQMASPLSRELIAGAIGESGAAIYPTMAPVTLAEAEKIGKEFLDGAGIKSIAVLRAMTTREIYEIYNESQRFGFPMVLDGYFLPKSLPEIFEAQEQANVPLLLGWNSAEVPHQFLMQAQPLTEDNYVGVVNTLYPEDAKKVLELYPHNSDKELLYSATQLASDRFIAYSTWKWADLHKKNSDQAVYRYLYAKHRPPLRDANLRSGFAGGTAERTDSDTPSAPEPVGAPHACEIEYALGNLHLVQDYAWTDEDFQVSKTMQEYFANFIKTGNPNGDALPNWPDMGKAESPEIMVLDVKSESRSAENKGRYLFLDEQYAKN